MLCNIACHVLFDVSIACILCFLEMFIFCWACQINTRNYIVARRGAFFVDPRHGHFRCFGNGDKLRQAITWRRARTTRLASASVGVKEGQNDIYYITGGNVALTKEQAIFEAAEQDLVDTFGILELLQQTSNVQNFRMLKQSVADEAKFPNNGVFIIDLKAAIEKESAHERLG